MNVRIRNNRFDFDFFRISFYFKAGKNHTFCVLLFPSLLHRKRNQSVALAAAFSGNVSACGVMGREIVSRRVYGGRF
jgi:hypothetical protein